MVNVSVALNHLQIAVFYVLFCCYHYFFFGGGGIVEDMEYFTDISIMIAPF